MLTSRLTTTLPLSQPLRAGREADRDDRRQQLRGQADRDREREQHRSQQRAAQRDVDHQDRAGQHGGHADEQQREVAQPELKRRLRLTLAELQGDRAELGPTAGTHDDAQPASFAHDGAHERARGEVQRGLRRGDRIAALLRRQRLAGEHRLVALQAVGPQQTQVCGHDVADREPHDIARHQLGHVDRHGLAITHGERGVTQLGMQRLDRQL